MAPMDPSRLALVEPAFAPTPGEISQLAFGARQSLAISMPEMPNRITTVQIGMYAIDQPGDCFRPVTAIGRPELRLRYGRKCRKSYPRQ